MVKLNKLILGSILAICLVSGLVLNEAFAELSPQQCQELTEKLERIENRLVWQIEDNITYEIEKSEKRIKNINNKLLECIPELFTDIIIIDLAESNEDQFINSNKIITKSKQVNVNTSILNLNKIKITTFDKTHIITKDIQIEKQGYDVWYGTNEDGFSTNLMIFDDNSIYGMIRTADSIYKIVSDGIDPAHTLNELDLSQLPPEHYNDEMELSDLNNLSQDNQKRIELLGNSHIGGRDYKENTVTINLVVGYTSEADDAFRDIERSIKNAVNEANRSYRNNGLPLELDLVDVDEVRGYTEEVSDRIRDRNGQSGLSKDLANLRDENMNDLDRLRGQGLRDDSDIIILVTHYPDRVPAGDRPNGCGIAGDIMVDNIVDSIAVIRDLCLDDLSLPHEIGHLQGAGHDPEFLDHLDDRGNFVDVADWTNPEFSFGHGYFDAIERQRTIMAYDHEKCDPNNRGFVCIRDDIWSDPNQNFRTSVAPTGTENINFNAKVLYATGEFISSLRGEIQSYDNINPRGQFDWGDRHNNIFNNDDIMDISAVFDEAIHDDYPPHVTIQNSIKTTTKEMLKNSDTKFSYSHQLTTEVGDITLSFSNARDLFGNEVVTAPTKGGSVTVIIPDTTKPVITLTNPSTVYLEVLIDSFTEPGFTATDDKDGNIKSKVIITGTIDENKIGTYYLNYDVTDKAGNKATQQTRTIIVQDTTDPVITLSDSHYGAYEDEGKYHVFWEATLSDTPIEDIVKEVGFATATDNYDPKPKITYDGPKTFPVGETILTWIATDSSGNESTMEQNILLIDFGPKIVSLETDLVEFDYNHSMTLEENIEYIFNNHLSKFNPPEVSDIYPNPTITSVATNHGKYIGIGWTVTSFSGLSDYERQIIHLDWNYPNLDLTITSDDYTVNILGDGIYLDVTQYNFPIIETDPPYFWKHVNQTFSDTNFFELGETIQTWTIEDINGDVYKHNQKITVIQNDDVIKNIVPLDDSTLNSYPLFQWTALQDNNPVENPYTFYLSNYDDFVLLSREVNLKENSYQLTGEQDWKNGLYHDIRDCADYYWRVSSISSDGTLSFSETSKFSLNLGNIECPDVAHNFSLS